MEKRPQHRPRSFDYKEILSRLRNGEKPKDIAAAMKCSRATVYHVARENGYAAVRVLRRLPHLTDNTG